MVSINNITITLTLLEAHAVHRALGEMAGKDYASEAEAEAGSAVYNQLTPHVDDEEDDESDYQADEMGYN